MRFILAVGISLAMEMFVSSVPVGYWCPYKCRCPSYHVANCSNVRLQELPSGEFNVRVTDLDLSNNQLSSLLEDHIWNLRLGALYRVNLSHNQIDYFDVHALRKEIHLKVLDLSFNRLSRIHPRAFSIHTFQLEWLSLSMNPSLYLMESGSSFISYSLLFLDLSHCNIGSIPNNTFKHLPKLQTLVLSHNNLKRIQKESFFGLVSLNTLDLSHNHLQCLHINIFDNVPELKVLTLIGGPLFSPDTLLNLLDTVQERKEMSESLVTEQYKKSQECICSLTKFYLHQRKNGNVTIEVGEYPELSDEEWDRLSGYDCNSIVRGTTTINNNASSMPLVLVKENTNVTSYQTNDLKEVTPKTAGTSVGWIIGLVVVWTMNVTIILIVAYRCCKRLQRNRVLAEIRSEKKNKAAFV